MYERIFKLWYYTVSHSQLLLRSLGDTEKSNIDIYFGDVIYIELPTKLDNIQIVQTQQDDIDYINKKIKYTEKKVTVLKSNEQKYYIVSSIMKVIENNLSMFELPFNIPNNMP